MSLLFGCKKNGIVWQYLKMGVGGSTSSLSYILEFSTKTLEGNRERDVNKGECPNKIREYGERRGNLYKIEGPIFRKN